MVNSMKAMPPEGSALSTELRVLIDTYGKFVHSFRAFFKSNIARLAVAVNAAIAALLVSTGAHAGPDQPNVLLIICDDCGYGAL